MAKKTIVKEVATALGAAAARVETSLKPKRSTVAKHSKAIIAQAVEPANEPDEEPAIEEVSPDREKVALVAYLRWESRGFQGGSPEEDWLLAEQELKTRAAAN